MLWSAGKAGQIRANDLNRAGIRCRSLYRINQSRAFAALRWRSMASGSRSSRLASSSRARWWAEEHWLPDGSRCQSPDCPECLAREEEAEDACAGADASGRRSDIVEHPYDGARADGAVMTERSMPTDDGSDDSSSPFHLVADMEEDISAAGDLAEAVYVMAHALQPSDCGPFQQVALAIMEHVEAAQERREKAFHLLHPQEYGQEVTDQAMALRLAKECVRIAKEAVEDARDPPTT